MSRSRAEFRKYRDQVKGLCRKQPAVPRYQRIVLLIMILCAIAALIAVLLSR
jgi:hypothetical protein